MPKYEYACKSCGERTEVKQSFEDDPLTVCTTCGGALRKVFSSPGIVLRGPGFYRTDHRSPYRPDGVRPADKEKESTDSKPSADTKGSGDSKSDSKGSDGKSSDGKSSDGRGSGDSKGSSDSRGSDSRGSRESRESGSGGSSGETGGSKDTARTA